MHYFGFEQKISDSLSHVLGWLMVGHRKACQLDLSVKLSDFYPLRALQVLEPFQLLVLDQRSILINFYSRLIDCVDSVELQLDMRLWTGHQNWYSLLLAFDNLSYLSVIQKVQHFDHLQVQLHLALDPPQHVCRLSYRNQMSPVWLSCYQVYSATSFYWGQWYLNLVLWVSNLPQVLQVSCSCWRMLFQDQ